MGAAVQDFTSATSILPGELEPIYDAALIHLQRSDAQASEEQRLLALEHWKATKNPDRARWAAHTAVLAPITTAADRAQGVVWAEIALETEPERPERLALQGAALFGRVGPGTR